MLYAVALAESAYSSDTPGFIAPSCLAIRASKPYYPKNRTEAREILERFIPGKENVDIGCMQISWRWHGKRFKSPEQLLDPATNISAASSILRNSIDSVPGQLALGIGRYHHWNISTTEGYERATSYGRRVLEILGNLRLLARHQ